MICQHYESDSVQPSVGGNNTAVPVLLKTVVELHSMFLSSLSMFTTEEVALQLICDSGTLCGISQEVSWKGQVIEKIVEEKQRDF